MIRAADEVNLGKGWFTMLSDGKGWLMRTQDALQWLVIVGED